MTKQNRFKIRKGNVLYEPSTMYSRVIEHEIVDIFLERYVSGYKTIFRTKSRLGYSEKFASDVVYWCDTEEEALNLLKERAEERPNMVVEETWFLDR